MKKRNVVAVIAALCLVTGCSQSPKETEAPKTEAPKTEASTEAPAAAEAVSEAAGAVIEAVSEGAAETIEAVSEGAAETVEAVSEGAAEAVEAVSEGAAEAVEAVSEGAAEAEEAVSEGAAEAQEAVSEGMADVEEAVAAAEEAVTEGEEAVEAVTEGAEAVTEGAAQEAEIDLGTRPTYTALDYVTLGTYKGLPVNREEVVVTDEEVDETIKARMEAGEIYDIREDGVVEDGDIANIDYVGTLNGEAFAGGSAQNFDLTIGSGMFIDGFEQGLVGVAVGEETLLKLTFPEDYHNTELAGQEVEFTVTVNSVKTPKPVSDESVSELTQGEYTTVDAYAEVVRTQITEQKENQQKSLMNNELMTQLYNTCTVNGYPQEVIDFSVARMKEYYAGSAEASGMTFEEMLELYGMDEETFRLTIEEQVKESMDQELILSAIAEEEKIEVSEEEIQAGIDNYAAVLGYPSREAFLEAYTEDDVRLSLVMNKAVDLVRENAVVTVVSPEEAEAVTEAATE